ncbi:MAG TPA: PQQ-binding-like beta-propeller repeat protein, partial [Methanomicrobiales archaeon]|nr:PQQ-binding-like beta-propeller repeat protein [Methanomicrobiales archaeon]
CLVGILLPMGVYALGDPPFAPGALGKPVQGTVGKVKVNLTLPKNITSEDWTMANYDYSMSRNSPQTEIGPSNVNQLQVKWIFDTGFPVENPPLIVGDIAFIQNNAMEVYAVDLHNGTNYWEYSHPGIVQNGSTPTGTYSHGMFYENGTIYAPMGPAKTYVALDASTGDLKWESPTINAITQGFRESMMPLVWKDYVVIGSALGDEPPFQPGPTGVLAALNKSTGEIVWQKSTVTGAWVAGNNSTVNGGATCPWGGSIDPEKGIFYAGTGNPSPDFTNRTRPGPNLYTNNIIAVNISDGKYLWATPFVASGSPFANSSKMPPFTLTDVHDYDVSWGNHLVTVNTSNGSKQMVIGHDKAGNVMAMDAATGKPIWFGNFAITKNTDTMPAPNGSPPTWPGPEMGIEDYSAVDNNTLYIAVTNKGCIFYVSPNGTEGFAAPAFDEMANGFGNGSVIAIDLATGNKTWEYPTDYPTYVSPLVTNGLVFAGHMTATGKPYQYNFFSHPEKTPIMPTGIIFALDKKTGKKVWEFNLGAGPSIGGASIGHGMLLFPTGNPSGLPVNKGSYVVAFGLPGNMTSPMTSNTTANMTGNMTNTTNKT